MVKSITTLVCSLLVMLSVSSCRKELKHSPSGSGCVTFTPSGARSTQEGTFEKGDAIGVFAIEPKSGVYWATNNKYTYDGRTFKPATEEDNIIVTVGTDFDFYVYYPFREGQTDITSISHSAGDQQEKAGWMKADFLTATYTDVVNDYTIPLDFKHRLSTVEVRVDRNDGVTGARIENVKYASRFNLLSGDVTTDDSRTGLSMYPYKPDESGTAIFRITIPAQGLATSSNYVVLQGSGTEMKLRGISDMTTEAGKIHNYRIDYKKQVSITDYAPGGSTTGAGLYSLGSNCTVTATLKPGYEFAGWYENGKIVSDLQQYSFEVLADRSFEPRYRSYGTWRVSLTASPETVGWEGGSSRLTAGASRDILINGVKESTETGVPDITGGKEGFSLSGNTVTVSENPGGSSRSCTFTASHGGVSATATITQEGSPVTYYFSYSDGSTSRSEYADDSSAGSFTLSITSYKKTGNSTSNLSWSASGDSWIYVNGTSVSYDENPVKERRTGNVTLKQEESGKTLTLKIVQPGKTSVDIDP